MSGNPFRRAQPQQPSESRLDNSPRPRTPPQNRSSKSKKKRVVIQTPPRSPDEALHEPPRRLSDGRTGSPPPPVTQIEPEDDTDSTATADEELEEAGANARRNSGPLQPPTTSFHTQSGSRAPYNPFARTLATSEAALGIQSPASQRDEANGLGDNVVATGPGRPALDVDAFKNILMSGTATPPLSRPQGNRGGSASASGSRTSAFDSFHLPESPRHSFDDLYSDDSEEDDNEHSSLMGPVESRPQEIAPPPPPKPGQYPQTVSFANFENSMNSPVPRPTVSRKASDLNKPLPTPPAMPAPTISESLQGLTLTPTREDPLQKKAPPPPPATRRQGQSNPTSGRARSSSNLTQGSANEDSVLTPTSSNKVPAPPPPPARRAQPPPPTSFPSADPSPNPSQNDGSSTIMPPPPPRRNPSKASGSLGRTSSTSSRNSLQRTLEPSGSNASGSAPPVPPPRRGPGASKRVSAEYRSSSGQSDGSLTSLTPTTSHNDSTTANPQQPSERDFMSDLAAFQAEIDALRAQAAKNVS